MSASPAELSSLIRGAGLPVAAAAERAGMSPDALERYLKGTVAQLTPRNQEKLERLVGELRVSTAAKEPEVAPLKRVGPIGQELYATKLLKETFQAVDYALENPTSQVYLLVSRSGAGKTRAARYRAGHLRRGEFFYIECPDSASKPGLIRRLVADLGLPWDGPADSNQQRAIDFLRKHPRLLLIDQAEELSRPALNALQYIWDQTGVPIVLLATYKLVNRAISGRSSEDLQRLRTRLWKHDLPAPSPQEVAAIARAELGARPWQPGAFAEFYLRTGQGSLRQVFAGLRDLEKLLRQAGKNGSSPVTREIVSVMARHLL